MHDKLPHSIRHITNVVVPSSLQFPTVSHGQQTNDWYGVTSPMSDADVHDVVKANLGTSALQLSHLGEGEVRIGLD